MNIKILMLIGMVFCHIADDYYLQGRLAQFKQKEWWHINAPDEMYRHDYLVALFMHSFSWACCIMLIPTLYVLKHDGSWSLTIFAVNVLIHMFVDDMKANKKKLNLTQDQSIHVMQVVLTWAYFVFYVVS